MAGYEFFVRTTVTPAEQQEIEQVSVIASRMLGHLEMRQAEIDRVHVHGAPSKAVQDIVAELLVDELGFEQEHVLTPEDGLVTRPRPDFYREMSPGRGILAEVERGGTTTNNHDLKDMWKAHLAPTAQHLFLIVPQQNQNSSGEPREWPFSRVKQRLAVFFGDPRREVDVLSLHIFGYGG